MPQSTARLIAIGGLSGSGKSTLSGRLAAEMGAVWLRSDAIRKELWGVAPTDKLPPEAYSVDFSTKTYAALDLRTDAALKDGKTVIVDMVFARESERKVVADRAKANQTPFQGFWLHADPDCLRKRVDARVGDISDATAAIVDIQLGYDLGVMDWTRIDAGGTAENSYRQIANALGLPPRNCWVPPKLPKP